MTYLLVLAFIIVGSGWLEWGLRTRVLRRSRRLLLALAIGSVPFVLWDIYAISVGHWSFDESQVTGVVLPLQLPLEEILFFIIVGFAAILTLEAVRSVRGRPIGDEAANLTAAEPEEPVT
ncbi:MAG: lycopene cyclase [Micrococcales bacterium]|nr:lycopene cyclase [Micrococcales bacterium]